MNRHASSVRASPVSDSSSRWWSLSGTDLSLAKVKAVRKEIERHVARLEEALRRADKALDDEIHGTPLWREKVESLTSVPGVGPAVSRTLLAELPELGTL